MSLLLTLLNRLLDTSACMPDFGGDPPPPWPPT